MKRTYIYGAVVLPFACMLQSACQEEVTQEDLQQAQQNTAALRQKVTELQAESQQAPQETLDELQAARQDLQNKLSAVDTKISQQDGNKAELIIKKAALNKEVEQEKAYTQQLKNAFEKAKM